MEDEPGKSNELLLLGVITGLCNQQPRDNHMLEELLRLLVQEQEARTQIDAID